jgi:hypothetical protein
MKLQLLSFENIQKIFTLLKEPKPEKGNPIINNIIHVDSSSDSKPDEDFTIASPVAVHPQVPIDTESNYE